MHIQALRRITGFTGRVFKGWSPFHFVLDGGITFAGTAVIGAIAKMTWPDKVLLCVGLLMGVTASMWLLRRPMLRVSSSVLSSRLWVIYAYLDRNFFRPPDPRVMIRIYCINASEVPISVSVRGRLRALINGWVDIEGSVEIDGDRTIGPNEFFCLSLTQWIKKDVCDAFVAIVQGGEEISVSLDKVMFTLTHGRNTLYECQYVNTFLFRKDARWHARPQVPDTLKPPRPKAP